MKIRLSLLCLTVFGLAGCQSMEMPLRQDAAPVISDVSAVEMLPSVDVGKPASHVLNRVVIESNPLPPVEEPPVDVWDRMRRGFAMPPLDSSAVEQIAQRFAQNDFMRHSGPRARLYLHYILLEIEKRNMPTELAMLPFVESAMNPQARSQVGAMGVWQFMPGTGRRFDMRISRLVDDRKNLMESTRGALDYLQLLHEKFGDWQLALASYNWGEGNISRAQDRNRALGLPVDYLSLKMPAETRNYVPTLEALKRIVLNSDRYGVNLPVIADAPYLREVAIDRDMDVDLAVHMAKISDAEFFALNPSVKRPLLMAVATPILLLPISVAESFNKALAAYRGKIAKWTAIRLKNDQRVATLAKRHGTRSKTLRNINNIPKGMTLLAGSTVLVPVSLAAPNQVGETMVATARLDLRADTVRVRLRARKGETLKAVSKRVNLKFADLVRWNSKVSAHKKLSKGQKLVAYVSYDDASRFGKKS